MTEITRTPAEQREFELYCSACKLAAASDHVVYIVDGGLIGVEPEDTDYTIVYPDGSIRRVAHFSADQMKGAQP